VADAAFKHYILSLYILVESSIQGHSRSSLLVPAEIQNGVSL